MSELVPGLERFSAIQSIARAGLKGVLPDEALLHASLEGQTLFFVVKHPLHVNEFRLKKERVLASMRAYWSEHKNALVAQGIVFKEVQCKAKFNTPEVEPKETKLIYQERSNGTFENRSKSPQIHALFENIRSIIKERA